MGEGQRASLTRARRKYPSRGSSDQSYVRSDILFHVELAAAGMSPISQSPRPKTSTDGEDEMKGHSNSGGDAKSKYSMDVGRNY
jgi:hypothetical protein